MKLIKSKYLGFCTGVQRAVEMAYASTASGKRVFTYGKLIHNKTIINDLASKGVTVLSDTTALNAGDTIIIRTHGVAKIVYDDLQATGAVIVDATCPFVANIHKKVAEYSANGYKIVIIGDINHPEVRGILGWCTDASVIRNAAELDFACSDKFYVVVQTTFNHDMYQKIATELENSARNSRKSVVLFNSICYTTKERQSDALYVADKADAVLIVGDIDSSNTMRLKSIVEARGHQAFLIENANDLQSVDINKFENVGILAGASTPQGLITEVLNIMATTDNINTAAETEIVETSGEMTMAEAMKSMDYAPRSLRAGMRLKVKVNSADISGITVSLLKSVNKNDGGFIPADEVELDGSYSPENYKLDDELDVIVIEKSGKSALINLSKKAFDAIKVDDEKVKGILAGDVFEMKIAQAVKGGLLGKIGSYTVFIPASQIRMGFVKNLEEYAGKVLKLKALPPKEEAAAAEGDEEQPKRRRDMKRIVASARLVIEEEKSAKEEEFWSNIDINMIVEGKVKRFTPFGAFVSVYNYDCLAHISDLAWSKINDPSEVLELGQTYNFVILKADRETGKVSLGYKQLQKKPYELAAEKYPVGTVIHGVVGRVQSFGAFVEIEPGIDGLVHVSQIGHSWIKDATQALKVGQEVDAIVTQFDGNKITLSMKDLLPAPEVDESEVSNDTADANEKTSRTDKFKKRAEGAEATERKPRRTKKDDADDHREYVSNGSGATMADLFKGLKFDNLDDGGDKD